MLKISLYKFLGQYKLYELWNDKTRILHSSTFYNLDFLISITSNLHVHCTINLILYKISGIIEDILIFDKLHWSKKCMTPIFLNNWMVTT